LIRFTADQDDRLARYSELSHISITETVRLAVDRFLGVELGKMEAERG